MIHRVFIYMYRKNEEREKSIDKTKMILCKREREETTSNILG